MKKIAIGIIGGSLAIGSLVGATLPATAATAPKICYFDNPTELKFTVNTNIYGGLSFQRSALSSTGPTTNIPDSYPLDASKFSGDCPSDLQPLSTSTPPFYYYRDGLLSEGTWGDSFSYHEDGVKKYRSPMQYLLSQQGGIRWYAAENSYYGYEYAASLNYRSTTFNSQTGEREYKPYLEYGFNGFNLEFLNQWVTFSPTATDDYSVWTGNAATENCDYVDASTCPGGYKFEKYVILPKNPINVKWKSLDTKISAKAGKKKSKSVTVTVNVDRQFTDTNGNDVKRYPGDKVTIKRGTKVVGTGKVNKNGVAKIRIKDIKGLNTYTVTIPETNRNWDATTTFVK